MSEDEHTCGKGIAANAVLPERMSVLLLAMASIYDNHMRSLDAAEPTGKREIDAYAGLARDFRAVGAQVRTLASAMRACHDLPMANHNMEALMDARSVDAMEGLVIAQEELVALLQARATEFRAMFEEMKKGG